jgi:hypothetical protein
VALLLEHGANPNIRNKVNIFVAMLSCTYKCNGQTYFDFNGIDTGATICIDFLYKITADAFIESRSGTSKYLMRRAWLNAIIFLYLYL